MVTISMMDYFPDNVPQRFYEVNYKYLPDFDTGFLPQQPDHAQLLHLILSS